MSTSHRSRGLAPSVLSALSAGLLGVPVTFGQNSGPGAASSPAVVAESQLAVAMDFSAAFEKVAADVSPSVVNITATLAAPREMNPIEEMQRRFFGVPGSGGSQTIMSGGSGVIVSADGYILTNNHVVRDAQQLEVRLADETKHSARVIGTDPATDLAVIKIDGEGFTPAKLGDSNAARAGQWVLAIGSPYNLSQTVTAGIVSAVGRRTWVGRQGPVTAYDNFIQTDASVNPGNSGGPLVNLRGEVVGINTAIFSRSGGSVGVGFAIPINLARTVMDTIRATGSAEQGSYLGVNFGSIEDLAEARDQGRFAEGVPIADVVEGAPADRAGIRRGDVITSIDGLATKDPISLRTVVQRIAPGRSVKVEVLRDGVVKSMNVTLAPMPKEVAELTAPGKAVSGTNNPLGVSVRELTPAAARSLGLRQGVRGVQIVEVAKESDIAGVGIGPNAVILSVNGRATTDIESFNLAAGAADVARGVTLQVFTREDGLQTLRIRNGRAR